VIQVVLDASARNLQSSLQYLRQSDDGSATRAKRVQLGTTFQLRTISIRNKAAGLAFRVKGGPNARRGRLFFKVCFTIDALLLLVIA